MEEEGVALGKPKDGEGNLESETAEGKPLMCSLSTGKEKPCKKVRLWQNNRQLYKLQKLFSATTEPRLYNDRAISHIYPPDRSWLGEKALWLLCGNSCRNRHRC